MTQVSVARLEERALALEIALQHLPADERQTRLAAVMRLLEAGELDACGIFLARDAGQLRGAVVCMPLAGAGGLVWPPQTLPGPQSEQVEDALLRAAKEYLGDHGARLAQVLLSPEESSYTPALERNGFQFLARLDYLRHDLSAPPESPPCADPFAFHTYDEESAPAFHRALADSYQGTLDCPELNGLRSIDEIIAGHKAQGAFDPRLWWLACEGTRPVGVLLTTKLDESTWDLSYVGVVPQARRRGLGRRLTQLALSQAHQAGARQLTVAVDQRNEPARKLYARLGFQLANSRDVYLAILS